MIAHSLRPFILNQLRRFRSGTGTRYVSQALHPQGLRILFCGSDEFSAASLKRLHEVYLGNPPGFIESLDVVVKAGKPSGRGLHKIRDVPVKATAQQLGLQCHEIKTFTGWEPPSPLHLVIAVSFGLKVPYRILSAASYGGLNLHPSLLPDLRGPAPLQHALLQGRETTGVTLQTLHPDQFDRGAIVAQRPFDIPHHGECTFRELYEYTSNIAAELLIEKLVDGSFTQLQPPTPASGEHVSHARKLTPEDAHVDWQTWDVEGISRTQRALGSLWSLVRLPSGRSVRVQWHGLQHMRGLPSRYPQRIVAGQPFLIDGFTESPDRPQTHNGDYITGPAKSVAVISTGDQNFLTIDSVTIEGRPRHEAAAIGIRFLLNEGC